MLEFHYRYIKHYDCSNIRTNVLKIGNSSGIMYHTRYFPALCTIAEVLHLFCSFIFIYIILPTSVLQHFANQWELVAQWLEVEIRLQAFDLHLELVALKYGSSFWKLQKIIFPFQVNVCWGTAQAAQVLGFQWCLEIWWKTSHSSEKLKLGYSVNAKPARSSG